MDAAFNPDHMIPKRFHDAVGPFFHGIEGDSGIIPDHGGVILIQDIVGGKPAVFKEEPFSLFAVIGFNDNAVTVFKNNISPIYLPLVIR